MKLRWLAMGLLGLLVLAVAIAATFPASLAYQWWAEQVPDVGLQGLSGSIWDGSAQRASVRGQPLGEMQWTLSPWALLGGRVSAHVRIDGPGVKLKTDVVRQADGSVRLSGLTGEAEAGWLGPALAIPALEPTGTLLLDAPAVEFDRAQLPRQVDAKIIWQNAGVRGQAVARLGTLTFVASGSDGHVRLDVSDAGDGDLQVQGSATLDGDRYRSETVLVSRVSQGPIVQALEWIGQPRAEGGRLLVVEGQIIVPEEKL